MLTLLLHAPAGAPQVQTNGDITPIQAMSSAMNDLSTELKDIKEQFKVCPPPASPTLAALSAFRGQHRN